jgi:hypothetical protein
VSINKRHSTNNGDIDACRDDQVLLELSGSPTLMESIVFRATRHCGIPTVAGWLAGEEQDSLTIGHAIVKEG